MKKVTWSFLFLTILLFSSCRKEQDLLSGYAQKGPFLNGSTVTLAELRNNYEPTGNLFSTEIRDNLGLFEFRNISLRSNYVTLGANGFYFNEVCGEFSNAQIDLNAIVDISASSNQLYVNVLTHLEKARVEYLLENGSNFANAKIQAQSEILAIFNISPSSALANSEALSITNSSEGDAILIAITSILQAYRSESAFSSLMADVVSDFYTDGILNNSSLKDELLVQAAILDTAAIKANIENRYADLGISVNVPAFGQYIQNFVNSNMLSTTIFSADYLPSVDGRPNVLDPNTTTYTQGWGNLSVSANLPSDCYQLRIVISRQGPACSNNACWSYLIGSDLNWNVINYSLSTATQGFVATATSTDLVFGFQDTGNFLIEYYEGGGNDLTYSKVITVN